MINQILFYQLLKYFYRDFIVPKPSKNTINIDIKAPIKTVCIFNNLGKEVFESTINKQQIDISNLTKGIYFIRIDINTTKNYYKKIVKL